MIVGNIVIIRLVQIIARTCKPFASLLKMFMRHPYGRGQREVVYFFFKFGNKVANLPSSTFSIPLRTIFFKIPCLYFLKLFLFKNSLITIKGIYNFVEMKMIKNKNYSFFLFPYVIVFYQYLFFSYIIEIYIFQFFIFLKKSLLKKKYYMTSYRFI